MPPKSKGQTIQLRDLQRMVYESGQVMDNILPSQSQGLERSDSYSSSRKGGGIGGNMGGGGMGKANYERYNSPDEKALYEIENTDWRKGSRGDYGLDPNHGNRGVANYSRNNNRENRYGRIDMEEIVENTNWRSEIGRTNHNTSHNNASSDKYRNNYDKDVELDFRRGSISRTNSKSNRDLSPSNYNWRDNSGTSPGNNTNQDTSFFGSNSSRYTTKEIGYSSKPIIDDRPDYLKNRFKKPVESSNQDSGNFGNKDSTGCSSPSPLSNITNNQVQKKPAPLSDSLSSTITCIGRHENLTRKLAQAQSQSQALKKNKGNANAGVPLTSKKSVTRKDNKKYVEPETNLSYWNIQMDNSVDKFEKELWVCVTGEEPVEKQTPKNSFSPGSFSPPKESCIADFINNIENSFNEDDLKTLTLVAKLSHVTTLMSSSLRCISDIILLVQGLSPLFDYFIQRNIAGKDLAELYILIESQRMAFTIGNPKIDNVTSLLEGLWVALLKTKVVQKETFNLWLNKTDSLASESKIGRKNALFEVSSLLLTSRCLSPFHEHLLVTYMRYMHDTRNLLVSRTNNSS